MVGDKDLQRRNDQGLLPDIQHQRDGLRHREEYERIPQQGRLWPAAAALILSHAHLQGTPLGLGALRETVCV